MQTRQKATAKQFLHLLGFGANSKCMSLHETNSSSSSKFLETKLIGISMEIPVTKHLKSHLMWWLVTANITKGMSLWQTQTNLTIILEAADWKKESTFIQFYFRNVDVDRELITSP